MTVPWYERTTNPRKRKARRALSVLWEIFCVLCLGACLVLAVLAAIEYPWWALVLVVVFFGTLFWQWVDQD